MTLNLSHNQYNTYQVNCKSSQKSVWEMLNASHFDDQVAILNLPLVRPVLFHLFLRTKWKPVLTVSSYEDLQNICSIHLQVKTSKHVHNLQTNPSKSANGVFRWHHQTIGKRLKTVLRHQKLCFFSQFVFYMWPWRVSCKTHFIYFISTCESLKKTLL